MKELQVNMKLKTLSGEQNVQIAEICLAAFEKRAKPTQCFALLIICEVTVFYVILICSGWSTISYRTAGLPGKVRQSTAVSLKSWFPLTSESICQLNTTPVTSASKCKDTCRSLGQRYKISWWKKNNSFWSAFICILSNFRYQAYLISLCNAIQTRD